jgi:hypothetical protein
MKTLSTFLFLFGLAFAGLAQKLPANDQVIQDVKGYHGKLASAQLNGDWQLVRETGYTFANTAKHPVAATTKKDAQGTQTTIQGLAIYVRGSANDSWRFSRYFVYENSRAVVGAKKPTAEDLKVIVEKALTTKASLVFSNCSWICWVYGVRIPEPLVFQQQSAQEMNFEAEVDYEERLQGMTERSKQLIEFFCRKINGTWEINYSMRRQLTPVAKRTVSQNILENVPGICDKPFAELYGPQGPTFAASKTGSGAVTGKVKALFKRN